jgi:hypothetical protein
VLDALADLALALADRPAMQRHRAPGRKEIPAWCKIQPIWTGASATGRSARGQRRTW